MQTKSVSKNRIIFDFMALAVCKVTVRDLAVEEFIRDTFKLSLNLNVIFKIESRCHSDLDKRPVYFVVPS